MKKIIFLFLLLALPIVLAQTEIDSCQSFTSDDQHYVLNQTVTASGTDCFDFENVNNVTVDCAGFGVNGVLIAAQTAAFDINGGGDITVQHCVIESDGGVTAPDFGHDYGFLVTDAQGVTIINTSTNETLSSLFANFENVSDIVVTDSFSVLGNEEISFEDSTGGLVTRGSFGQLYFEATVPGNVGINVTNSVFTHMLGGVNGFAELNFVNFTGSTASTGCLDETEDMWFKNIIVQNCVDGVRGDINSRYTNITVYNSSDSGMVIRQNYYNTLVENLTIINATGGTSGYALDVQQGTTNITINGLNIDNSMNNVTGVSAGGQAANKILGFSLDCRGGVILGDGSGSGEGLYASYIENFTHQNCTYVGFEKGALYEHFNEGDNVLIQDVTTTNNTGYGTRFNNVTHAVMNRPSSENDFIGIGLYRVISGVTTYPSTHNTVYNYTASLNSYDLNFGGSSTDNNLSGFSSENSNYGVWFTGAGDNIADCEGGLIGNVSNAGGYFNSISTTSYLRNCRVTGVGGLLFSRGDNQEADNISINVSGVGVTVFSNSDNALVTNTDIVADTCITGAFRSNNNKFVNTTVVCASDILTTSGAQVTGWNFTNISGSTSGGGFDISLETKDNYYVDCVGGSIIGVGGGVGFNIGRSDNHEVRNCVVYNFSQNFFIGSSSTGSVFEGNNVQFGSVGFNVSDASSSSNTFTDNLACYNTVDVADSDTNTWSGNSCDSSTGGASCADSCKCVSPLLGDWDYAAGSNCSFSSPVRLQGSLILNGTLGAGFLEINDTLELEEVEAVSCQYCDLLFTGELLFKGLV